MQKENDLMIWIYFLVPWKKQGGGWVSENWQNTSCF